VSELFAAAERLSSPPAVAALPQPPSQSKASHRRLALIGIASAAVFAGLALAFMLQGKEEEESASSEGAPVAAVKAPVEANEAVAPARTDIDAAPPKAEDEVPDAGTPSEEATTESSAKPAAKKNRERGHGRLVISSDPWAKVYVDGKSRGQTPFNKKLPAGSHKVVLKNEATGDRTTHRIKIKPGQTVKISEEW
jgi:serine/threonine-protein kinase